MNSTAMKCLILLCAIVSANANVTEGLLDDAGAKNDIKTTMENFFKTYANDRVGNISPELSGLLYDNISKEINMMLNEIRKGVDKKPIDQPVVKSHPIDPRPTVLSANTLSMMAKNLKIEKEEPTLSDVLLPFTKNSWNASTHLSTEAIESIMKDVFPSITLIKS